MGEKNLQSSPILQPICKFDECVVIKKYLTLQDLAYKIGTHNTYFEINILLKFLRKLEFIFIWFQVIHYFLVNAHGIHYCSKFSYM